MASTTRIDMRALRRVWRAISPETAQRHPTLRARVSLNENGSLIGISERNGRFCVECDDRPAFERLDDAEAFAAGRLFEREGAGE